MEVKKKKMGRPTTNPKTKRLEIRLSESENNLLEECVRRTGRDRTAVIVKGIAMVTIPRNRKPNKAEQRSRRPVEREAKTVADRRNKALWYLLLYHKPLCPVKIDGAFSYKSMTQKRAKMFHVKQLYPEQGQEDIMYETFLQIIHGSVQYEIDNGVLTLTGYYTGKEVKIDLNKITPEMLDEIVADPEDENEEEY